MDKKRIRHSAEFKARVALEALTGLKTVNELAGQYQLHPIQVSQWKRQIQRDAKTLFGTEHGKNVQEAEGMQGKLYEEVGPLKMKLEPRGIHD